MFTSEAVKQQFTQANIGVDREKIKERVKAYWFSISKSQRQDILDLAGVSIYTVQRSYTEGSISSKLVIAFSQVLKVNPAYLTGDSDESQGFSNGVLVKFLETKTKKKKKGISAAQEGKDHKGGRKKSEKSAQPEEAPQAEQTAEEAPAPKAPVLKEDKSAEKVKKGHKAAADSAFVDSFSVDDAAALAKSISSVKIDKISKITDEELALLLNSLTLKAKFNATSAELLSIIKCILVI